MLHWIFKSERVQDFIIGEYSDVYVASVVERDVPILLAYMRDGDASGLDWRIAARLDELAETCHTGGRRVLDIIERAVAAEVDAKEAARPRDIGDLYEAVSDAHIRLDGEVCDTGQQVLDAVHEIQGNIDHWIDNVSTEEHGTRYRETDMSRALLSTMVAMVNAVDLARIRGAWDSTIPRLKRWQFDTLRKAADELGELRFEDMRRYPQLRWTEAAICQLHDKIMDGARHLKYEQVDWTKVDRREHAEPGICICGIPFGSVSNVTIDGRTGNLTTKSVKVMCCRDYPRELARAVGAAGVNL
jgi:hypothetical protein